MNQLITYLENLNDTRKESIIKFHADHLQYIEKAKGSGYKHQAWKGGYLDHLQECFNIAENIYTSLSEIRTLPFKLDQALIILYFHDIEKIWKYTTGEIIDKYYYYQAVLPEQYNINFSEEEQNALKYIHGENDDYCTQKRIMNELAAFCHSVDTISARIWYDYGNNKLDLAGTNGTYNTQDHEL